MNGDKTLEHLKSLYRRKRSGSRGSALRRALLSVAVPATATLAIACYGTPWESTNPMEPHEEVCTSGRDDDYDGFTDCDDTDCERLELCLGCSDGLDNDGDGRTDCADSTCSDLELCQGPGACSDEADNDGDGEVDCFDADCAGQGDCD